MNEPEKPFVPFKPCSKEEFEKNFKGFEIIQTTRSYIGSIPEIEDYPNGYKIDDLIATNKLKEIIN